MSREGSYHVFFIEKITWASFLVCLYSFCVYWTLRDNFSTSVSKQALSLAFLLAFVIVKLSIDCELLLSRGLGGFPADALSM
jgi:hypothetical protein